MIKFPGKAGQKTAKPPLPLQRPLTEVEEAAAGAARRPGQVEQRPDPALPEPDGRDSVAQPGRRDHAGQEDRGDAQQFRRTVLSCSLGMQNTISTLTKVHKGILPFDRTVKVSLTERLTKEQILGRMPHNLETLTSLTEAIEDDFRRLISKRTTPEERVAARKRFIRRRANA